MPGKYYMLHKIRTLRIVPNRTFTRESVEAHDRASKKLSLDAIYKGVATGVGGGEQGGHGRPTSISEPNKVQQFQFQTSGTLLFYGCSEIIQTRNFTIFTVYTTIFGQIKAAFHFFLLRRGNRSIHVGPSEKVRYSTQDLLKSFLLWTIRKKTTMNEFKR